MVILKAAWLHGDSKSLSSNSRDLIWSVLFEILLLCLSVCLSACLSVNLSLSLSPSLSPSLSLPLSLSLSHAPLSLSLPPSLTSISLPLSLLHGDSKGLVTARNLRATPSFEWMTQSLPSLISAFVLHVYLTRVAVIGSRFTVCVVRVPYPGPVRLPIHRFHPVPALCFVRFITSASLAELETNNYTVVANHPARPFGLAGFVNPFSVSSSGMRQLLAPFFSSSFFLSFFLLLLFFSFFFPSDSGSERTVSYL